MVRLLISLAALFFHSHTVLAQGLPTDDQKNDYCKGVSASQIAIISALLRDDGGNLSLSQIKILAISEATKIKNISDTTRMGIVAHTNNFEEQHIVQMRRELQKEIRHKNLDLATYRDLFNKNIPSLMVAKFKDCKDEIK
jgi:hypothetical protein